MPRHHTISDLNSFLMHHRISKFEPLRSSDPSKKGLKYEHNESVREMQNAMADVVREDLLQDIRDSGIFSVMADESTDVSNEKTLMLYVRYEKNGAPNVKFLEVVEIAGDECNARNICETILKVLSDRNLSILNMACLTTDGASVMTGIRGGVTTLMKEKNQHLLSMHCIAHRLALASGQAADSIPYLKKYQAVVNSIFKYFHYSPRHQSRLNKIQNVYEMAERKFKQTFHTRWLSFEGAVDSIISNYDSLVLCLEADVAENDDPTARGILTFITDFQFLATSYLLSDILSNLALLSKVFQKRDLDLANFDLSTRSTISVLKSMQTCDGPKLKRFLQSLPDNFISGFEYGCEPKFKIKCSQKSVDNFNSVKTKYLEKLLQNLNNRFEDNGLISCFGIFNPKNLPPKSDDATYLSYGMEQINLLSQHYTVDNSSIVTLGINDSDLVYEWPQFKEYMDIKFRKLSFQQMCSTLFRDTNLLQTFPNVCKLVKIAIIMPVSSADCERGFARYNLIKTSLRNRLKPDSVNVLMTITFDQPPIERMEEFNFSKAFDLWAKTRNRQIKSRK